MTKDEMLKERDDLAEECPKGECRNYYLEGFNAAMELMEEKRVKPLRRWVEIAFLVFFMILWCLIGCHMSSNWCLIRRQNVIYGVV